MSKVSPQSIPLPDFCVFGGTGRLEMGKWEFFLEIACRVLLSRGNIWLNMRFEGRLTNVIISYFVLPS